MQRLPRIPNLTEEERLLFESEGLQPPVQIHCAVGCDVCRDRGYRDRIGVFEIVQVDEGLSTAIQVQHCEKDIQTLLRGSGVPSLLSDGLQKAATGITSIEEIMNMSCMPLQTNGKTDG